MVEASRNPHMLYLVREKLQFSSKMMLKLGAKYFDKTLLEKTKFWQVKKLCGTH